MSRVQDIFGASPKSVLNKPFMQVQDQKPVSTDGGGCTAGDNIRDLNVVVSNEISGASLAANEVTLPAGEYYIECTTIGRDSRRTRAEIKTSGDVRLLVSTNTYSDDATQSATVPVAGKIVLSESTAIKVNMWTDQTTATNGLGRYTGLDPEIYTDLRIWKLDSNVETVVISDPTMTLVRPLLHVRHQETTGVNNPQTAMDTIDRTLNTVKVNEIAGASLVANEITLPAGEYFAEGYAVCRPGGNGEPTTVWLAETGDTVLVSGGMQTANGSYPQQTQFAGRFTLSATTVIKVKSRSNGSGTGTHGEGTDYGGPETYVDVRIWQIDAVIPIETVREPGETWSKPMFHAQDQKPTSTNGGTSSATSFNHRDLNTILTNEIAGAALSDNEITLPAGEYYIEASAPSSFVNESHIRLRTSADADLLIGQNMHDSGDGSSYSSVKGRITLPAGEVIKLSHWTSTANADDGLGRFCGVAPYELYAEIRIWRLDAERAWELVDPEMTLVQPLLHVQDQKASGTNGGDLAVGYNDRDLNTILTNEISGASLSGDEVTLPAGTYYIEAISAIKTDAVADNANRVYIRETNDTVLLSGVNRNVLEALGIDATVEGRITLSTTTIIKLSHYAKSTNASNGLGKALSVGDNEVYADLRIWKLDAAAKLPIVGEVILESYQYVDATGVSALTLDCTAYDTFEIEGTDMAMTILLDDMNTGRTIVISIHNGAADTITFLDTIAWTDGLSPTYTANLDTIVLTKLGTGVSGAYTLNQT